MSKIKLNPKAFINRWQFIALLIGVLTSKVYSQTTITTPYTGSFTFFAAPANIAFVVENTNGAAVILNDIGQYMETADNNSVWQLYYSTTSLSNSSTVPSAPWTLLATSAAIPVTTNGIKPTFSGLGFSIPASTHIRFVMKSTGPGSTRYVLTPSPAGDIFSGGGVNLKVGTQQIGGFNVGYSGAGTALGTTPRYWHGSITFAPSGPCTSPPTAGTSTATPSSGICIGTNIALGLSGATGGSGQTYQWQEATAIGGPYSNLGSLSSSPSLNTPATSTKYYRCEVTCSGNSQISTPVLVTVNPAFAGGTYTINSAVATGGTNFQTFNAFISALNCGISGAVVANVVAGSGPYNEQVIIPQVSNVSSTNTITINGNGATLTFGSTVSTAPSTLELNGSDYFIFNNLNITGTGATYAFAAHLWNNADNNQFNNCVFTSPNNTSTTTHVPFSVSGSVSSATGTSLSGINNVITGCTMNGGYYGATLVGNSASVATGNKIVNCQLNDAYIYSIYLSYQNGAEIKGNTIERPTRTTFSTFYGVYMTTSTTNLQIHANRIKNPMAATPTTTTAAYGIYAATGSTAGNENKIYNNIVYDFKTNGTQWGIYVYGYFHVYHNTVSLDYATSTAGETRGIYIVSGGTGTIIRNNIVYITRAGTGIKHCLYFAAAPTTCDNNVLHINAPAGTNYTGFQTSSYATLANWQAGTVHDDNSVAVNPAFVLPASGDFTPTSGSVNNIGSPVGITVDINNAARSLTTPDPGAYEFSLGGLDAAISWVSPTSPAVAGLYTVTVNITNAQSQTITDLQLSYNDGSGPVTQTFSGLNITAGNNQNISFTTQYNFTANATITASILTVNGGSDANSANNSVNYSLCVSLGGTYTINAGAPASSTNFQSFTAAINALSCGIANPVVFNVAAGSGPYNEQLNIPVIGGTSAVNTITVNGNGNTLTNGTVVSNYATLNLNGADYFTFNNLIITASDATNGFAVHLMNSADNNTFNGCTMNASLTGTGTTTACVSMSGSTTSYSTAGTNGVNNLFTGCTTNGGYFGFVFYGNTSGYLLNANNSIVNCTVQNYYVYGAYNYYQGNSTISNSIFQRPTRATVSSGYGVYITTGCVNMLVEKNKVRNMFGGATTSTSLCYGYYNGSTSATAGNENKIINNLYYGNQGAGTHAGVYNTGGTHVKVYHNTVSHDYASATAGTTYGIYNTSATGTDIQNNVVNITRGGTGTKYCLYYSALPAVSNYNGLYINAPAGTNYIGYNGSSTYATLALWQGANPSHDQQSVSANPLFASPGMGNYKPTQVAFDNIGAPLGITDDITNAPRSPSAPDPGAYEFTLAAKDVGVFDFVGPTPDGCYTNAETIIVQIKNYGTQMIDYSVDPVTVNCVITGPVNTTVSVTLTSGTIASGATQNVSLAPTVDGTANGTYFLNAATVMTSDGESSNDAFPEISLTVGPVAGTVSSTLSSICVSDEPVLTVTGVFGGDIVWQESATSGSGPWTNVGTNSTTYNPGTVTQTTWYQALTSCNVNTATSNVVQITVTNPQITSTTPGTRCGIGTVNLGATASAGTDVKWYTTPAGGTAVATGNTYTTSVITSTTNYYVSAAQSGSGTQSVGKAGLTTTPSVVGTYYMNFTISAATTIQSVKCYFNAVGSALTLNIRDANTLTSVFTYSGTTTVSGTTTPQLLPINASLNPGTYQMGWTTDPGTYRESTGSTYPYTIPGVISITGNTFNDLNYYYYFYDWIVVTGCESPRTMVTATVTPPPSINVAAVDQTLCPGGTTTVNVTSANDPDYTYAWSSNPAGFTASGAGPHNISPTATTWYIVTATDNSAGPNAGCVAKDSTQVVTGATLSAGTVSASASTFCQSGVPTLSVTGADGGAIQWQSSTVSGTGPWTNVGTGSTVYAPGTITQTTWYQVRVQCQSTQVFSNVQQVIVNNPQITSSSGATRCGPGTVNLSATPSGGTVNWYTAPSGGTSLATGNIYSPNVTATTTYYAGALAGSAPFNATIGTQTTTTQVGMPYRAGNGTAMRTQYLYTASELTSAGLSAGSWNQLAWTLTTAPSAGTMGNLTIRIDHTAISALTTTFQASPSQIVYGPVSFTTPTVIGDVIFALTSSFAWNGTSNVLIEICHDNPSPTGTSGQVASNTTGFVSVLAVGNVCGTATGTTQSVRPIMKIAGGTGCEGTRVPVVATVTPSPSVNISVEYPTICNGQSATITATSSNPGYTYTWTPGGTGSSITVSPASTTVYNLNAADNSGGIYDQCAATGSTTITRVNQDPPLPVIQGGNPTETVCEGGSLALSANNAAAGQSTTYSWSTNASIPFTSALQTPNVTSNAAAGHAGTYTAVLTNQYLCTSSGAVSVIVNPNPTLGGTVTNVSCWGTSNICDGAVLASASGGGGSYLYDDGSNFNTDGDFSLNQPLGPVAVCFGPYTVNVSDANGCSTSHTFNIGAISTAPPTASVVVPPINNLPQFACNGTVVNNINVPSVAGSTKYNWDGPVNTDFNGQGNLYSTVTPTANITFGALAPTASGYYIGVQAANGCGGSIRKVQWVRGTLSTPLLSGSNEVCEGGSAVYTVTNAPIVGAQNYTWTGPAGTTFNGNATPYTTTSASVTAVLPAGYTSGSICVTANASCISSVAKCMAVSTSPSGVGIMSGVFQVCPGSSQLYSVPSNGTGTYNWTLPSNATGSSTSNSILISFTSGFTGGNISVTYTNPCGVTSSPRVKSVSIGTPMVPASITGLTNGICGQIVNYSCPAVAGATSYTWSSSASTTISNQGTTSVGITFGTFTTGTVSVMANGSCGSSAARTISIKGSPNTPGAITANPPVWCNNDAGIIFSSSLSGLTGTYLLNWAVNPAGAATYVSGQGTGTYITDWLTGNATVSLTASNACGTATRTYAATPINCTRETLEPQTEAKAEVSVYPNPASEQITISYEALESETVMLELKDISGRVVSAQQMNVTEGANQQAMNVSKLAKGVYMLDVKSPTTQSQIKVVVQ